MQGQIAYQILYQRDKALAVFAEPVDRGGEQGPGPSVRGLYQRTADSALRKHGRTISENAMRLYHGRHPGRHVRRRCARARPSLSRTTEIQRRRSTRSSACQRKSAVPRESARTTVGSHNATTRAYAEASFYIGLINWQQSNYEQALAVLRPLAEDLKLTSVYNTLGAIAVQAARAEKKNEGKSAALLKEGLDF